MAVTTAAGLFYFGWLLRELGPESLGAWLAWLALGMIACLADLGLRESLVRRVAVARGRGDDGQVVALIDTTVLTVALSMAAALVAMLALAPWLLPPQAASASPWLVGGIAAMVWLQRVADVHAAALEGLQQYERVARNNVAAALVGVATLLVVLPHGGVDAASVGLIVQYALAGSLHAVSLSRSLQGQRGWLPRRWSARLAREGLGFGLSVQVAIGSFLIIESSTKLLLARQDALALVAFYDLAFRVGRGLRNLLVAGNRVLVPRLARASAERPPEGSALPASGDVQTLYLRSFEVLLLLAVPVFSLAFAAAGLISIATRGGIDPMMLVVFFLVLPAWFVFCTVDPVINVAMGTGAMRPLVVAHVAMLVLLALIMAAGTVAQGLGLSLGPPPWQGAATLAAATLSVVLPSLGLLAWHHRAQQLPLQRIAPLRGAVVIAWAWAVAAAVHLLPPAIWAQGLGWLCASVATVLGLRALPGWTLLARLARRLGGQA